LHEKLFSMLAFTPNICTIKDNPTDEQKKIITNIDRSLLVLAPAGSGKTRTLAGRVCYAVTKKNIPAGRVLCITFTNKAAQEMREKVKEYCPSNHQEITIKTFHGLCTYILRTEAFSAGIPKDFTIYDEDDCKEIIKEIFPLPNDKKQRIKEIREILDEIEQSKKNTPSELLSLSTNLEDLYSSFSNKNTKNARRYQEALQKRHALDFNDLIFYVRALFNTKPEVKERWSERFDLIQVDEVQDTHVSEYEIISILSRKSNRLALIGDFAQTIYEWRGSEPKKIIEQFRVDFNPIEEKLTQNFRSTKILQQASSEFAKNSGMGIIECKPAETCNEGEQILLYYAGNEKTEASWIGKQIQKLALNQSDFHYNRVAVLTRDNATGIEICKVLKSMEIPCLSVEQYKFFDRKEVKEVIAYLKLIVNPNDLNALKRLMLETPQGVGCQTIELFRKEGEALGLNLTDLINPEIFISGDPFGQVLKAFNEGEIVVFDVETTGLSAERDEVIEIAATRLLNGQEADKFHYYIKNTLPVGESEKTHHISDSFLSENGKPAYDVLQEFIGFVGNAHLIGHNVGFDIKMITAHAQRANLDIPVWDWSDTWDLATRFISSENYKLLTLARLLELSNTPSHKADDDVATTVELLKKLIPHFENHTEERILLISKYKDKCKSIAKEIADRRTDSYSTQPSELLRKIVKGSSGLWEKYRQDTERADNLRSLLKIISEKEDINLRPDTNLRCLLEFISLTRNLDHLSKEEEEKILIITVHQSKGLEFDSVFMAGLYDGCFPSFRSVEDSNLDEETRTFYVAMTRAKQRLFMSAPESITRYPDRIKNPSQFIRHIPAKSMKTI